MKNYYISIDSKQTGPHTMEEIKTMNLSDKDLIWNENLPTWFNVMEFEELNNTIKLTPPPLPGKNSMNQRPEIRHY